MIFAIAHDACRAVAHRTRNTLPLCVRAPYRVHCRDVRSDYLLFSGDYYLNKQDGDFIKIEMADTWQR